MRAFAPTQPVKVSPIVSATRSRTGLVKNRAGMTFGRRLLAALLAALAAPNV